MSKNQVFLFLMIFILFSSCGKVAGDGELTDGVLSSDYRAFVTSSSFSGNLGGLTGADAKCAQVASNKGLTRTYKAILSDNTTDAEDRVLITGEIYTVETNGDTNLVASSGSDLWNTDNTSLLSAIDLDENGSVVSGRVWTGTGSDGGAMTDTCSNWTSTGTTGGTGNSSQTNEDWVEVPGSQACNNSYRIYCISQ